MIIIDWDKTGENMKQIREARGLKIADVANKIGVTPAAVYGYESGCKSPRIEIFINLLTVYNVLPNELLKYHIIPDSDKSLYY